MKSRDWSKMTPRERYANPEFVAAFVHLWPTHSADVIQQRLGFVTPGAVRNFSWELRKRGLLPPKSPAWLHTVKMRAGRIGATKRWKADRSRQFDDHRDPFALDRINVPPATIYDAQGRAIGTLDPVTRERHYFSVQT